MSWFFFSVATAFCDSLKDLFSKWGLQSQDLNPYFLAWATSALTVVFLTPMWFFIEWEPISWEFLIALCIDAPLMAIAWLLYVKAIKVSDLGACIPMLMFSSVFLLFTSPIMIGEFPTALGLVGVLLVFIGSYLLNLHMSSEGMFAPMRELVRSPGPKLMLLVAFIWSITSNFDRIGVNASNLMQWGATLWLGIFLCVSFGCWLLGALSVQTFRQQWKLIAPIGAANACMVFCHLTALQTGLVVYVISIKRCSTLLSMIWGRIFFKEGHIAERLLGAGIMLLGVLLIGISSF